MQAHGRRRAGSQNVLLKREWNVIRLPVVKSQYQSQIAHRSDTTFADTTEGLDITLAHTVVLVKLLCMVSDAFQQLL
jgi:hypothetical protein